MSENVAYAQMCKVFLSQSDNNRAKFINMTGLSLKQNTRTYNKLHNELLATCSARTSIGTICSRKCIHIAAKFCSTHIDNPHKYDHIEKRLKVDKPPVKTTEVDISSYIRTQSAELFGQPVLIDDYGIVYDKKDLTMLAIIRDDVVQKF